MLRPFIIAASLVAVAVTAAGVAITANPAEVSASPHMVPDLPCNEAEIYDVQLAAAEVFGRNLEGAVQGSALGCSPACVLTYPTLSDPANAALSAVELADLSRYELTLNENLARSELLTLTEAEAWLLAAAATEASRLAADAAEFTKRLAQALAAIGPKVSGKSVLFEAPTRVYYGVDADVAVGETAGSMLQYYRIAEVQVAPNQHQCHAYDVTGRVATGGFLLVPDEEATAERRVAVRRAAEARAAEEALAEQGAAEEDGVAPQTLIAVVALLALALGAVAVRGIMAVRSRQEA